MAKLLLGCYRTGDANDPAVYTGAMIAVLSDYPLDVIAAVVDPRTGLPSRLRWLPTIAEVKEACEEIYAPQREAVQREKRERAQLAERAQFAITDQRPRKTPEQHRQDLAEHGIFIGGATQVPVKLAPDSVRQNLGISREQWDAIPNAPEQRRI